MTRGTGWVLGIVLGGFLFFFLCFVGFGVMVFAGMRGNSTRIGGGDRVGVIEVLGEIADSKKTLEAIDEFEEDKDIKAVVLRVDSPGGAVAPSQEIYDAVRRLAQTKKVVVSMGSLAASGGYYIASAGSKVYANAGTLTGSIGVIFQLPNVEGVMKWAGVEMRTITAGKMKDIGSPFRQMTPDERAYFEGVLKDVHDQFIQAVAQGRNLKPEEVTPYADGRVFTGRQAKEWKLVDEVGGFSDAVAEAGKLGGIEGKPELEFAKDEKTFLQEMLSGAADSLFSGLFNRVLKSGTDSGLQYRMPTSVH